MALATFGGGCFWCLEAVYLEVRGVTGVKPGYMGGQTMWPSYEEVCGGATGHAEVVQIEYDEGEVRYEELLEVLFAIHDPTTLNRQGADVGTQYRSAVFYHDAGQAEAARAYVAGLAGEYHEPVVTEIVEAGQFWEAEPYHHNYYAGHAQQPYCAYTVAPKVMKFRKKFEGLRKG